MKVLTIQNPYGYLICYGIKDIENRSWKTKYRGSILIHTSSKEFSDIFYFIDKLPLINFMYNIVYKKNYNAKSEYIDYINNDFILNDKYKNNNNILSEYKLLQDIYNKYLSKEKLIFRNSIIGKVNITDIIKNSNSKWAQENLYHWVLEKPLIFQKPILNIKGKLGLWNYNNILGE